MDSKGLKVLFKNIHKKLCPMIEDKEVCEGINDSYIDDVTTHFIRFIYCFLIFYKGTSLTQKKFVLTLGHVHFKEKRQLWNTSFKTS